MTAQTMNAQGTVPQWTLGDRMGKALDHAGIGMQEMADYLGVSRNSVSNWVHGRVPPSRQTLLLWSMRTGVDLEWITRGQPHTGWSEGEHGIRRAIRSLTRRGPTRQRVEVVLHAHPHNHPAMRHLSLVRDVPEQGHAEGTFLALTGT